MLELDANMILRRKLYDREFRIFMIEQGHAVDKIIMKTLVELRTMSDKYVRTLK
jgi:hypothetical protein